MDTYFKMSTLEHIYNIKQNIRRPKDIEDIKVLETFINQKKLEELLEHPAKKIHHYDIKREQYKL